MHAMPGAHQHLRDRRRCLTRWAVYGPSPSSSMPMAAVCLPPPRHHAGNGTGGESIWGGEFGDEITRYGTAYMYRLNVTAGTLSPANRAAAGAIDLPTNPRPPLHALPCPPACLAAGTCGTTAPSPCPWPTRGRGQTAASSSSPPSPHPVSFPHPPACLACWPACLLGPRQMPASSASPQCPHPVRLSPQPRLPCLPAWPASLPCLNARHACPCLRLAGCPSDVPHPRSVFPLSSPLQQLRPLEQISDTHTCIPPPLRCAVVCCRAGRQAHCVWACGQGHGCRAGH